jgi:hypothetical protein
MNTAHQEPSMDQPLIYRIEVQGRIDVHWVGRFDGKTVTIREMEGIEPITALTGVVADQPALHELLRALYSLGFLLVCVACLDPLFKGYLEASDTGGARDFIRSHTVHGERGRKGGYGMVRPDTAVRN